MLWTPTALPVHETPFAEWIGHWSGNGGVYSPGVSWCECEQLWQTAAKTDVPDPCYSQMGKACSVERGGQ